MVRRLGESRASAFRIDYSASPENLPNEKIDSPFHRPRPGHTRHAGTDNTCTRHLGFARLAAALYNKHPLCISDLRCRALFDADRMPSVLKDDLEASAGLA